MNDADVAVSFTSEAARIDLNLAAPEMLAGLFAGLGAPQAVGDGAAQSIVAWRERASAKGGANASTQLNGGNTNGTASLDKGETRSMFAHANELTLVEGIPPALIERALPFVTVFQRLEGHRCADRGASGARVATRYDAGWPQGFSRSTVRIAIRHGSSTRRRAGWKKIS